MFLSMNFDASGAKRQETLWIFAEVENKLLRMESTMLRFVDLFTHQ